MEDLTFSTQLLKIKAKLKFWKPVTLCLIRKIKVLNIYIHSRLRYRAEFYDIPTYILSELNRETTDFIWGNKKHDFNQDILMTNTGNGGLSLINISSKVLAQRVMWLKTVLSYGKDDFTRKLVEFNLGENDGYLGLDMLQAKVDKVKFTTNKDPFYKNMFIIFFIYSRFLR